MLPYFILLAIVVVVAYFTFEENKPQKLGTILLFIILSLFGGLRDARVGTDTGGYTRNFEQYRYLKRILGNGFAALTEEPGFYYLQKWLGEISNEYVVFLMGISVIFCFFVLRSICRNSSLPVLSLFVFITLGYYTFFFNAARQGLAMSIYMMAIPFLLKKRFWPYTLIVLAAALFHKTIVIAIPLYFVFTMKYSIKSLLLMIGGGLLVGFMLPNLLSFSSTLEDRYILYTVGSAVGGYMLTLFYIVLAVFFVIQRGQIKPRALPRYDVYLHMLITGSTIYLVVMLTRSYVELTRFAAYFQIASVFLWAMIVKERQTPLSPLVYMVAIAGHLGFFAIFLSRMANLTPYLLNSKLFN